MGYHDKSGQLIMGKLTDDDDDDVYDDDDDDNDDDDSLPFIPLILPRNMILSGCNCDRGKSL